MNYFSLEIKKLLRFRSYRITFFILFLIVLAVTIIPFFQNGIITIDSANIFVDAFQVILFITSLAMVVVAAQFVSSEYLQRTVQFSLASGVSRKTFILAKAFALFVGTYILVFLSTLFALILAVILGLFLQKFHVQDINFLWLILSLIFAPLKIFPFMFISFFLAVFSRTSTFAIVVLFFYSLLGEFILTSLLSGTFLEVTFNYLPGKISGSLNPLLDNISTSQIFPTLGNVVSNPFATASFWIGLVGILAYLLVFNGAAYVIFRRQDLTR